MSSRQRRSERHARRARNGNNARENRNESQQEELTFDSFDPFDAPMTIQVMDDTLNDDAAVAKALQEEYEAEYARSQYSRHQTLSRNVIVPGIVADPQERQRRQSSSSSRRQQSSGRSNIHSEQPTSYSQQVINDEALARQLQQKSQLPSQNMSNPAVALKRSTTAGTSRSDGDLYDASSMMISEDEYIARRVEQEMDDADLAFALSQQEQQRAQQRAMRLQQQQQQSTARRVFCVLLPTVLMAGAVGGIMYFFMFGEDGLPAWMPSPEEFAEEDPFSQKDPSEVNKWRTGGRNGLELNVLNALDDEWFPFFYTAVYEWDSGVPDAVDLSPSRISVDSTCKTVPRALKVCNGNYGETSWRGINKLLLEDDDIYASAARMNEFYFQGEDSDQRQYTMCHEIGHGLGLPHTDESFTNPDLGNCMDYTNRPENNRQPDETNYIFLAELYGTVPGADPYIPEVTEDDTAADGEVQAQQTGDAEPAGGVIDEETKENTDVETQEKDKKEDKKEEKKEKDKGKEAETAAKNGGRSLLDSNQRLLRIMDEVDREIELGMAAIGEHSGWTLLHRSSHGEAHEKRLDERYRVRIHFMLA